MNESLLHRGSLAPDSAFANMPSGRKKAVSWSVSPARPATTSSSTTASAASAHLPKTFASPPPNLPPSEPASTPTDARSSQLHSQSSTPLIHIVEAESETHTNGLFAQQRGSNDATHKQTQSSTYLATLQSPTPHASLSPKTSPKTQQPKKQPPTPLASPSAKSKRKEGKKPTSLFSPKPNMIGNASPLPTKQSTAAPATPESPSVQTKAAADVEPVLKPRGSPFSMRMSLPDFDLPGNTGQGRRHTTFADHVIVENRRGSILYKKEPSPLMKNTGPDWREEYKLFIQSLETDITLEPCEIDFIYSEFVDDLNYCDYLETVFEEDDYFELEDECFDTSYQWLDRPFSPSSISNTSLEAKNAMEQPMDPALQDELMFPSPDSSPRQFRRPPSYIPHFLIPFRHAMRSGGLVFDNLQSIYPGDVILFHPIFPALKREWELNLLNCIESRTKMIDKRLGKSRKSRVSDIDLLDQEVASILEEYNHEIEEHKSTEIVTKMVRKSHQINKPTDKRNPISQQNQERPTSASPTREKQNDLQKLHFAVENEIAKTPPLVSLAPSVLMGAHLPEPYGTDTRGIAQRRTGGGRQVSPIPRPHSAPMTISSHSQPRHAPERKSRPASPSHLPNPHKTSQYQTASDPPGLWTPSSMRPSSSASFSPFGSRPTSASAMSSHSQYDVNSTSEKDKSSQHRVRRTQLPSYIDEMIKFGKDAPKQPMNRINYLTPKVQQAPSKKPTPQLAVYIPGTVLIPPNTPLLSQSPKLLDESSSPLAQGKSVQKNDLKTS